MPIVPPRLPQDLHIHTTFSTGDGAILPEQTIALVASVGHASIVGISDHLEFVYGRGFEPYRAEIRRHGLHVGVEVNGHDWIEDALAVDVEYYIYHCRNVAADYRGAEQLAATGRPVIIAHPMVLETDLDRVPPVCLIELNNRYVWRNDWRASFSPYVNRFRFVIGSDAHQPHWLNQSVARMVAAELGIQETLLFDA